MIVKPKQGTSNLSVLGILIRTNRMQQGYSLRDLAEITKISHTLISNIEKGKQTPSENTLSDIFNALKMKYYDDPTLSDEISNYYSTVMMHLINHEYDQAGEIVAKMEEKEEIYTYSNELISYLIIKLLYYALTDKYIADKDLLIERYEVVYDFFTDEQKQMFCFIRGLDLLNDDYYFQATEFFNEALTLGNKDWDAIIKEYNIRSLLRQYKFTDVNAYAREAIEEFEQRTIYLRAMSCRLLIARVYLHIMKFDKMLELVNYVELFATKFNVDFLTDECKSLKAWMHFLKGEYDVSLEYLDSCSNQESEKLILPRLRLYLKGDESRLLDYYNEIETSKKDHITRKKYLLIKVLVMWNIKSFRVDEIYLKSLLELRKIANHIKDQENVTLTYNLLIQFYKEKNRYKKALEIAEEFLQKKKIGL